LKRSVRRLSATNKTSIERTASVGGLAITVLAPLHG
jgi:hypothetical protein